jgi:hypothetical protein
MASRSSIAIRTQLALEQIREVLAKYDPEVRERLSKAANNHSDNPDAVPSSIKQPELFAAYLAESVASLAQIVDRRLARRPPGRPRKNA